MCDESVESYRGRFVCNIALGNASAILNTCLRELFTAKTLRTARSSRRVLPQLEMEKVFRTSLSIYQGQGARPIAL
jgi:hypothetical protein